MADSSFLSDAERALIDEKLYNEGHNIPKLVQQVVQGDFAAALSSDEAKRLLSTPKGTQTAVPELLDSLEILRSTLDGAEDEIFRLAIGVAALHSFVQVNWTGPDLSFASSDVLYTSDGTSLPLVVCCRVRSPRPFSSRLSCSR